MPSSPATSEPAVAIAAENLQFDYGQLPVLSGLRWQVPAGRISAVTGLAGAGKSTLLALLAGALRPQSGQVSLLGSDPAEPRTRRLLGYMPQAGGLYPHLSAEEHLQFFARAAGAHAAIGELTDRTLTLLGLSSRRQWPVSRLSADWQQRVSFGCALVAQPQVILLDEPFAFADAAFVDTGWRHLRELAQLGRTIVLATSRPDTAARADRIAILRAGRFSWDGNAAEIGPVHAARVRLTFREKTGPLIREERYEDYREAVPALFTVPGARPSAIEVAPISIAERLKELLFEDPHAELRT